jgi:uncharacterized protein YndB with AHSA1/START domain
MNETAKITSPQNSVIHSTFSIERIYPHAPARVFFAHADQAMKRRWFAEGDGWSIDEYKLDFRLNGSEVSRFRYQDGPEIRYDAAFYDIIPDRRIVFAYRMAIGSKPLSVSLSTIELLPCASGTLLAYAEQGAYFDDPGGPEGREEGTRGLLEKLAGELESSR